MVTWHCLPFSELTTHQLYELMRLRVDVFVVEQNCPYPELDGHDTLPGTQHLLGYRDNVLVAYARLLPAGTTYDNVSIGRVGTLKTERREGMGHKLLRQAIAYCCEQWPGCVIEIGAQEYLKDFYRSYGFVQTSEMYLEDGIPHVDMVYSLPHTLRGLV